LIRLPGLLSHLLGKTLAAPGGRTQTVEVRLYIGNETLEVVGESYCQDVLWQLVGGRTLRVLSVSVRRPLVTASRAQNAEVRRPDSGLRDPEPMSEAKRASLLGSVGLIDGAC
jgi:hypothetical protein